jgi:hypothetical protein
MTYYDNPISSVALLRPISSEQLEIQPAPRACIRLRKFNHHVPIGQLQYSRAYTERG